MQYTVSDVRIMAEAAAKSGLFGMKTTDQALALMMLCQAEGIHPMKAVAEYHIINGKPSLKADAMLARFQRAGGTVKWNRLDDKEVSATFSHPQGGEATINWTIEMAKNAGLTGKDTWKQYPRQLLRSRVISEGVRTVFPGVSTGIYTPEEVSDFTDQEPKPTGKEGLKSTLKSAEGPVVDAVKTDREDQDGMEVRRQLLKELKSAVSKYSPVERDGLVKHFLTSFGIEKMSELRDEDIERAQSVIGEMHALAPVQEV